MKEGAKNFSYLAIGRTGSSLIRAGFLIFIATLMEPNSYGQLAYIVSLAGAFSVVSRFGLPTTVVIYLSKGKKQLADNINLIALITTSLASILLVFIDVYAAFLCFASSLFFLHERNQIGNQKYKEHMIALISRSVLILGLGISLFFVAGIPGIIVAMAFANLIFALPFFRKISIQSLRVEPIKENYKVILNNFGVESSQNLIKFVDKLAIGIWFGFLSLGSYYFNMQILFAIQILSSVLHSFLISEIGRGEKHKKFSVIIVAISIILTVLTIVVAPFVIESAFPKYVDGVFALQILVIAAIPNSFAVILTARMQSLESTKVGYSAVLRIGSLIALIGLLGTMYGIVGLSVAVVISITLHTLFLGYLYKKHLPVND